MYSFGELFATYLSAETVNMFSNVKINECKLNSDTRSLHLKLHSDVYIPYASINTLREEIKHALKLEKDFIDITFESVNFSVDAVADTVAEIRTKNIIFNGFFNEAQYSLDGSNLKITLKYGGFDVIK